MAGKLKKAIISCLLALGISVSYIGTDIVSITADAYEDQESGVVISSEDFDDITLSECEKIVDGIDLEPNENGEVCIDLTEEELYALIKVTDEDKSDIYDNELSYVKDDTAYSDGCCDFYYNQLNAAEKELYNNFETVVKSFLNSSSDYEKTTMYAYYDPSISYERANAVFAAFYYENPQYYVFPARYYVNSSYESNGRCIFPFGVYDMLLSADTRTDVNSKVDTVTKEWLSGIEKCSTLAEKETYIANTLCEKITYTSNGYDQSIYGSLILNACVCNGYTMAFTYLCNMAGIDAVGVTCTNHAWNFVKLNGIWYCVDVTWMDGSSTPNKKWYNQTYETFQTNDTSGAHTLRPVIADNFDIPVTGEYVGEDVFAVNDGDNVKVMAEGSFADFINNSDKDYTITYTGDEEIYSFITDLSDIKAKSVTFAAENTGFSYVSYNDLELDFDVKFASEFNVYGNFAVGSLSVDNTYVGLAGNVNISDLSLYNSAVVAAGNIDAEVHIDNVNVEDDTWSEVRLLSASVIDKVTLNGNSVSLGIVDGVNAVLNSIADTSNEGKINLVYMQGDYVTVGDNQILSEFSTFMPYDKYDMLTVSDTSVDADRFISNYYALESADDDESTEVEYNVYKSGNKIGISSSIPLSITSQPESKIANVGDIVSFEVKATGTGLTYQWQYSTDGGKTWKNSAAKTATYKVQAQKAYDGYMYRCIVTDKSGKSLTSVATTLTVNASLAITSQPESKSANVGDIVSFEVKATGNGLTYQWQYSTDKGATWKNSAAKKATYKVQAQKAYDGYMYRCIVTDKNGKTVASNAASLTINASLAITSQPQSKSANVGDIVSFEIKAAGTDLAYQWQYSTDGGKTWKNSATKTATYKVQAQKAYDGYMYRCIVTDKSGKSLTSAAATLTINASLAITSQPQSKSADVGELVTYEVKATGNGLTYQWQYSTDKGATWKNSAAKTATYRVQAQKAYDGYMYRCVVTDKSGKTVTSNAATLTINASLAITSQPVNKTANAGEIVTFEVKATGTGLTYRWQYSTDNGVTWKNSAAKSETYRALVQEAYDGYMYRCVVTDASGTTVTSNAALLMVV